jgi:Zn-dependent protease/predicted transcriptional regulator
MSGLSLPKIAGIKLSVHWTFSILIIWIIYTNMRAGLDAGQIGWSVLFILSLFVCVTLHELGHALAARHYGIQTKDITLYPIGGVARLERMPERPAQELVVALAGPLVNIIIMFLLLPVILGHNFEMQENEKALIIGPANFLPMLGVINVWLALFNLIPAFPMDGGRVLRALLSFKMNRVKATSIAMNVGKVLAIGFVFLGFYTNPFLIFIGLFIILGAQSEYEMVKSQFLLSNLKVTDALMTQFSALDEEDSIQDAVRQLLDSESKNFVITSRGIPVAVLTRDDIIRAISDNGVQSAVREYANYAPAKVEMFASLNDMLALFQRGESPLIFVYNQGSFMGVVDYENVTEILMLRNAGMNAGSGA